MPINQIPGWDLLANHNPASINGLVTDQLMEITKQIGLQVDEHHNDINQHMKIVDNVAVLRATSMGDKKIAFLTGYTAINDGGEGIFRWDDTSIENDDGGIIFAVTGVSIGRWKRIHNNTIDPKWYSDFNTCITALGSDEYTIAVNHPVDLQTGTVTVPSNISLVCKKNCLFSNGALTINGVLEAGPYLIFDNDCTVNGTTKVLTILPEWDGSGTSTYDTW